MPTCLNRVVRIDAIATGLTRDAAAVIDRTLDDCGVMGQFLCVRQEEVSRLTTPSRRPSDPNGATGVLAEYLAAASLDDLPEDVVERAHHLLLDGVGCGLLAARMPWSNLAVEAICDIEGDGPVLLWGWGRRVPPGAAALLHGTFIPGFELNDYHQFGPLHSAEPSGQSS